MIDELKQKNRERAKAWYHANKEKARAAGKEWRLANPGYGTHRGAVWRKENPLRAYEHGRAYRAANKDKIQEYSRKWAYKHRTSARARLLAAQGGRCAICRSKNPGARTWHRDHDSKTKIIRGILCRGCNHGLGQFREKPKFLLAAARYLKSGGVVKTKEKYF